MLSLNINHTDEPTPMRRIILRFILAFALTLAMRVRFEVGAGLETGNFLVDNLSKFANQFFFDGITDVLLFAFIWLLLKFTAKREKHHIYIYIYMDADCLLHSGCILDHFLRLQGCGQLLLLFC